MIYFIMLFAGGITGLFIAGPGGSIFGAISGLAIAAWQELTDDETDSGGNSSHEWSDADDNVAADWSYLESSQSVNDEMDFIGSDIGVGIGSQINPATCLPMLGSGIGGFDVAGNPYGVNLTSVDMSIGSMSSTSSIFDE